MDVLLFSRRTQHRRCSRDMVCNYTSKAEQHLAESPGLALHMLYMDKLGVVLTGVIFQLTSGPKCTNKPVVEMLTQPMQIQLQSQRGQLTHQLSALAFMHKVEKIKTTHCSSV